ncbi:MAG: hypothetical protein P4M12_07260 [Gammaproteobacteria bacterium]|nr:hypothetical protein [Gammaproteobacteria bacterium]
MKNSQDKNQSQQGQKTTTDKTRDTNLKQGHGTTTQNPNQQGQRTNSSFGQNQNQANKSSQGSYAGKTGGTAGKTDSWTGKGSK